MICANSRSCVQKAEFRSRHLCYSPGSLRSSSQDRQSWVVFSQAWLSVLPYSRAGYSSTSGVCAAFCTAACLGLDLPERKECGKLWKVINHCGLSKHRAERRSSPKRKNAKQFLIVSGLPCMLTGVAEARSSCYTMTSRMEQLSGPTKSRCPSALL